MCFVMLLLIMIGCFQLSFVLSLLQQIRRRLVGFQEQLDVRRQLDVGRETETFVRDGGLVCHRHAADCVRHHEIPVVEKALLEPKRSTSCADDARLDRERLKGVDRPSVSHPVAGSDARVHLLSQRRVRIREAKEHQSTTELGKHKIRAVVHVHVFVEIERPATPSRQLRLRDRIASTRQSMVNRQQHHVR
jgi:hypothetical protein